MCNVKSGTSGYPSVNTNNKESEKSTGFCVMVVSTVELVVEHRRATEGLSLKKRAIVDDVMLSLTL